MMQAIKLLLVVVTLAAFGACAIAPRDSSVAEPDLPSPPASDNSAVIALLTTADAEQQAGRYPGAAAAIERALRVEPKNPRLWQRLARLRLSQGDYMQAENLAARSNSWAGSDGDLRAENWRLIAEARAARGDEAGAKAAHARAKQASP